MQNYFAGLLGCSRGFCGIPPVLDTPGLRMAQEHWRRKRCSSLATRPCAVIRRWGLSISQRGQKLEDVRYLSNLVVSGGLGEKTPGGMIGS